MSKVYRKTRKKSNYISKGTGSRIIHTGHGSIAKKRVVRRKPKTDLAKDTRRLVNQANARLRSLERRHKTGTWASKTLKNRLGIATLRAWKNNRVRLRSNLTNTQLASINKAISSFLKSKTATNKGIEEIRQEQIENIKERLTLDDEKAEEMTDEEAEFFYDMFGDSDFQVVADKVGASALQAAIQDAIEEDDSEDMFIQRVAWYGGLRGGTGDLDIQERAIRIYNKYVLGG